MDLVKQTIRSGLGLVAFAVVVIACSEASVVEDSAAACSNGKDDDGDGFIDCEDPDCAATEVCERTEAACANAIDDDKNGAIDCRQESCRALPTCKDAVETRCLLLPRAEGTGCPIGKGCYITPDNRRWCALEGPSLAGGPCGDGDPSDRSQGCAAGYLCGAGHRCARICFRDYDCTRNSICRPIGSSVSLCTSSCARSSDCRAEEECLPLQRTGLSLERGGWAHQCIARAEAPPAGTAAPGQPCVEDSTNRAPAEVCRAGLLCVPEPGSARCREVCAASIDGRPGGSCRPGSLCYAIVPFSAQDDRFDEPTVVGVCLP